MLNFQLKANTLIRALIAAVLLLSFNSWAAETVWIDVRTAQEYDEAHLSAAVNIPYESIAQQIAEYAPDTDTEIVLYCRSGRRAETARESLQQLGYDNVINAVDLDGARKAYQQHNSATASD